MVKLNKLLYIPALIIIDQLAKLLVPNASIDLKIFTITTVKNTGSIWGFFKDSNTLLIWISIIAIGVLIYFYDDIKPKFFLYLIFAGIIGNLIDRIFRGYVLDFIDFKFWPVSNFADAFITIGVIGLIFFMILKDKK